MRKRILFLVFGILVSLFGIYYFLFPNLSLDYRTYEFRIGAYPQSDSSYYIRNYSFTYDFIKEEGILSFGFFDKEGIGDSFQINFPPQLAIISYTSTLPEVFNCENKGNYLTCTFENKLESLVTFIIEIAGREDFEEEFLPNGLFIFGDVMDFTLSQNYGYEKDNILLNFNLGNKYRCREDCFIREMRADNLNYYPDGNNLVIYSLQGENDVSLPHFRLHTYSHEKKLLYGACLTFLISLLAGIIVVLLGGHPRYKKKTKLTISKPLLRYLSHNQR